jgi:hypothetical protein
VQFFPRLVLHRFGIGLQPLDVLPNQHLFSTHVVVRTQS